MLSRWTQSAKTMETQSNEAVDQLTSENTFTFLGWWRFTRHLYFASDWLNEN